MNPSLYLIKYDGFDCVYGLELQKDERVQGLEVLPDRLGKTELRNRITLTDHCGDRRLHNQFILLLTKCISHVLNIYVFCWQNIIC